MTSSPADIAAEVRRRLANRTLLLLCDFDGTLCEFDPDPAAVFLSEGRQHLLRELSARQAITGIISGRRLRDLRERVGAARVTYLVGFHGMEVESAIDSFRHPDVLASEALVHEIAAKAAPGIAHLPGVFIEDKEFAVALHYRAATPAARVVGQSAFMDAARDGLESGRLRVLRGSFVIELLPNTRWNKGSAVEWIRERAARVHPALTTVYVGDDVADEDAFAAVGDGGVTIGASLRVTHAEFHVDGPAGVEAFLRALCGTLS